MTEPGSRRDHPAGRDPGAVRDPAPLRFQENFIRFVHVLRRLGVPVNPAETLDALAALNLVNLADRSEVKAGLRATLVKSEAYAGLFERAFDLFFLPPEERERNVTRRREIREAREARMSQANTELVFQGRSLELTADQLEAYTRLADSQRERLRDFLAESSAGNKVDASFQPLIESIVRGHLDRWRHKLEVERRAGDHLTGDEELDTVIEGALDAPGGSEADPLIYLDMKDITEGDLARATVLIRRLARRLATRLSRRYRESRKRRRPNIRRTIRSNIRHGGVLFDLRYRERRLTRPRLLLISDVSGSMVRYTVFILEFIFGLAAAVNGVEAFVFSERLERVTDRVAAAERAAGATRGAPFYRHRARSTPASDLPVRGHFASAAARVVRESQVWGKGTDLGEALEALAAGYERLITRDTVVIIVSDTKTLGADRVALLLQRLRPRVREILWLNTLPREEWSDHRTVTLFARHTEMHECHTLAHLERVIRLGVGRHIRPA